MLMMVLAVIAGLVAVVLAARWISNQANLSTNKIAVAATNIDLGSPITPIMIKLVDWPAGSVPAGSFNDPKLLDTRVAKTTISPGEPILEAKLAPVGSKGGLSAVVAPGKRAMTVRVNDVVGVAGFALPGNYVYILVNTMEENAKSGNKDASISKIVLDKILVLAVAQESNRDETKAKVVNAVTLEVSPEQAELLDLARSVGTLSLVLRNQVDPKLAATDGATKNMLLNLPEKVSDTPEEKPKAAPAKTVVRKVVEYRAAPIAKVPEPVCVEVMTGAGRVRECY
jgi:pilus assembly protein CpaB